MTQIRRCLVLGLITWQVAVSLSAAEKEQLDTLRSRIEQLRGEIVGAEETRAEARDQLRESERAISEANRSLRDLTAKIFGPAPDVVRVAMDHEPDLRPHATLDSNSFRTRRSRSLACASEKWRSLSR